MSRRRPAFDPSRLDDIDELLPLSPPQVETSPGLGPAGSAGAVVGPVSDGGGLLVGDHEELLQGAGKAGQPAVDPARVGRGQGGRPPQPHVAEYLAADSARVQVAVRIAHALYEQVTERLLAGAERPSYGQLVLWACEDQPDAVLEQVVAARPGASTRRPRGRRLAAETVQLTLRLTLSERSRLDDIADRVREIHPGRVTRTEVAAAALRTAIRHIS